MKVTSKLFDILLDIYRPFLIKQRNNNHVLYIILLKYCIDTSKVQYYFRKDL